MCIRDSLSRGSGHTRDGVAYAGVLQRFDGRGEITYLTRLQRCLLYTSANVQFG